MNFQALKEIYTEAEVDEAIALYKEGLKAIVEEGQSFDMKGRTLTMVDVEEMRKTLAWYANIKISYSSESSVKSGPQINVARPGRD
ncbi:hypothetical protein KAR91_31245 [Candidatus Pacearchaeota archaeon]|nr:hypothetical protein [Candidatus Pacearchaeota archaeon]